MTYPNLPLEQQTYLEMLPLLILSTVIATAVNAHPQGGSQGVLGWCVSIDSWPLVQIQSSSRKADRCITATGH